MFENEGAELETQSDATTETSSESPSTEAQSEAPAKEASEQSTDNTPFHEHPRFKELVDQKNQALSQLKELQDQFAKQRAELAQPKSQTQAEKDELIEDLKKIDPRLAERLEKFSKAFPSIESMQNEFNQYKQQQVIQTALTQINSLHESNKVDPELKQKINNELDLMYMQNKLTLQNLQSEYKRIHDGYKTWEEAIKRKTLEGYVPAKKADAKVPTSQPKGEPAKPAPKKPNWSKDPEVARQQVVSRYLKLKQAESESSG